MSQQQPDLDLHGRPKADVIREHWDALQMLCDVPIERVFYVTLSPWDSWGQAFHALDHGLELWLDNGQILCIIWGAGLGAYHLSVTIGAYYLQQSIEQPRSYQEYAALPEPPDSYYEEVTQSSAWAPLVGASVVEVATSWERGLKRPGIVEIVFSDARKVWFCSANPWDAEISGSRMNLDSDNVVVMFDVDAFERSFGHLIKSPNPQFFEEKRTCAER
ncbi:MAG TPA: hypothetical protein V6D47_06855 [Oscillatoriaceae cyanobacterium]